MRYRHTVVYTLVSVAALVVAHARGDDYPNRPVRIVTSEPGGNGDYNARLLAQGLTAALGQQVIVENRRGTIIAAQTAGRATPDGYTLLANGSSFWIGPLLQKMPYDPIREFATIAPTTISPSVLVVHSSVPAKTVPDLIALANARPGQLNYAAAATGSPAHMAGELFKYMAHINVVGVFYKGAGPALNDLIGGQVQFMFASAASAAPHIKSGRLNALAVSSARPSALFPGLITVAAAGLPGYESGSMQGIWAPLGISTVLVKRLNQEIVRILERADVKEQLLKTGAEASPGSPEQLASAMKAEMNRLGKVIKEAGIKGE